MPLTRMPPSLRKIIHNKSRSKLHIIVNERGHKKHTSFSKKKKTIFVSAWTDWILLYCQETNIARVVLCHPFYFSLPS